MPQRQDLHVLVSVAHRQQAQERKGVGHGETRKTQQHENHDAVDALRRRRQQGKGRRSRRSGIKRFTWANELSAPAVTAFEVGDRVAAVIEGAFASEVNVPATSVMSVPDHMDFAQAATVPVAFLTAWYGLVRMAGLQRGERLLIHSAAGGVGSAALAIARVRGAEVLATAGTPDKRTYLHEHGVRHVMDSHSTKFGDETPAATDGEGVDVVLNSLTGELLRRGLELLRVRGRFVEIGKRDIMADAALGLGPFRNSLSMHSVDLRLLVDRCPELIGELLGELAPLFASGALAPLPYTPFPVTRADGAFRKMMGGRRIGKIVLTFA
ncbi:zinc-binding dehydrogenase (plasmid) [Streptomyces sp. NBC_01340]|uniref:zinc-binding dehydrogenase n=1 Tax=Streptomyces sp. NBC_01340 TaxID=2903830 RepID=UPI002E14738E|nr:zinc-binding dehydrogenase [Streptomyces sp. NBC_01340]